MHNRERTVTTRELLRNFKTLKQALRTGKLHVVRITIGDGEELQLLPIRRTKTAGDFVRAVRELRHPLHIRRTHLFDDLLVGIDQPIDKRKLKAAILHRRNDSRRLNAGWGAADHDLLEQLP